MPPHDPPKTIFMHPTTPERLKQRTVALEKEEVRESREVRVFSQTGLVLPCGCKVEPFRSGGLQFTYCNLHRGFIYSSDYPNRDVIFFVTGENQP